MSPFLKLANHEDYAPQAIRLHGGDAHAGAVKDFPVHGSKNVIPFPPERTAFGRFLTDALDAVDEDHGLDAIREMIVDATERLGMARDASPEQYAVFEAGRSAAEASTYRRGWAVVG